jgi:hypothetical protein
VDARLGILGVWVGADEGAPALHLVAAGSSALFASSEELGHRL